MVTRSRDLLCVLVRNAKRKAKEMTRMTRVVRMITERGEREYAFPACVICGAYRAPYQACIIRMCAPAEDYEPHNV